MQRENRTEYKLLREEMQALKDCITNYMGFVLGGSGAAIFGLASVDLTAENAYGLGVASLALAALVTVVLAILFYKFNSHNRYAGYCKLLTHERYTLPKVGDNAPPEDIHAWEVCMARLRDSDFDVGVLTAVDGLPFLSGVEEQVLLDKCRDFGGHSPGVDKANLGRDLSMFAETVFGRRGTRSWGFPLYVIAVFLALTILFVLAGGFIFYSECVPLLNSHGVLPLLTLGALVSLWGRFLVGLVTLDEGSRSVDAFCWKFVQIRRRFLGEAYGLQEYRLGGVGEVSPPTAAS